MFVEGNFMTVLLTGKIEQQGFVDWLYSIEVGTMLK